MYSSITTLPTSFPGRFIICLPLCPAEILGMLDFHIKPRTFGTFPDTVVCMACNSIFERAAVRCIQQFYYSVPDTALYLVHGILHRTDSTCDCCCWFAPTAAAAAATVACCCRAAAMRAYSGYPDLTAPQAKSIREVRAVKSVCPAPSKSNVLITSDKRNVYLRALALA